MARRVLIVEDDADTRDAFMLLLELWGLEAYQCANGPEAVVAAAQFRPDVAVVDISLPGMDGITVAKALTVNEQCPFLIALTGHGEPMVRQQALDAGFDLFALKPWDLETRRAVLTGPDTVRRRTLA